MRKFYQSVAVVQGEGGYAVQLDGKPVKTPAQQPLVVATAILAEAMAEEWRAQGESIHPDTMPITRIVTIAIDRVPHDRNALLEEIVRYAGTDLLCYRAPSPLGLEPLVLNVPMFCTPNSPSERERGEGDLRALQDLHFTPILTWAAGQGIALHVTESLTPISQPESSLARVRHMVAAADDTELAALALITPLLGSAVLALALWQGAVEVEEALRSSRLDEAHQAARWGEEAEAMAAWAARARDIRGAYRIFRILLDSQPVDII
jgi:chaperone required for assembly of F1-ATPase